WLEGQDCAGCSESLLASLNPSVAEIVLDTISLRYHETIMAASGELAEQAREETVRAGGYIMVVEGSIPRADDRFCTIGNKPFREIVMEVAEKADLIIGVGSCAMYGGGVPGATPSEGGGVAEFVRNKPIINLPTCPVKPSRLVATIMYYLAAKKVPELDKYKRPLAFYANLLHDNCPRRGQFEKGNFVTDWNDPRQRDYCLLLKGCKGPRTYTDCAQVWWNEGANFCINAGAPCAGCSQPEFYGGFNPLYAKQDIFDIGPGREVNIDTIGAAMAGAAAAGVVVHGLGRMLTGNGSKKDENDNEKGIL
ncbi:hydrogenase small subunit, partial [bacterium]